MQGRVLLVVMGEPMNVTLVSTILVEAKVHLVMAVLDQGCFNDVGVFPI